jgi:hypothetical protein
MDVKGAQALADRIAEAARQVAPDCAESTEEGNEPSSKWKLPKRGEQHPLDTAAAVHS